MRMFSRLAQNSLIFLLAGVLAALAGCGTTIASSTPGSASPEPGATPSAAAATPTAGPGTPSSQAITIATDRSTYAGTDVIKVTVTNHTAATIYAAPGHASCTILTLEMLVNGQWQASDAAPCPTQPALALVQLRPNAPYQGAIRGLRLPYHPSPFPAGTYRLVIAYWKAITGAIPSPNDANSIISPTFTVH
jgi:hypothetical protein